MIVAIVLLSIVALAAVAVVAWPFLRESGPDPQATGDDPARRELQDDIERSMRAIREIEFDHRAGNLSDEDFQELDRAERARAAELLRRRDESEG